MKHFCLKRTFHVILFCLFQVFLFAQNLGLGDIIISGYNTDADPNNPNITDDFSFVLLKFSNAGETISFTDRGWLAAGGFREGEGSLVLTFSSSHDCGSEFRIVKDNGVWQAVSLTSGSAPSLSENGNFSLSSSGDQIFCFSGTSFPTSGDDPGFITAIQFAGPWNEEASGAVESTRPSVFATNPGYDFVVDPHFDNGKYDCFINAGSPDDLRLTIYTPGNWGFDNSSTNRFDLATPCPFFCQDVCTPPSITSISSNSPDNRFCLGEEVTISIDGSLNGAALWTVNAGSCEGQQQIATSSNSFSFTAVKTTTLYISGFGGCVLNLDCTPISIVVEGVEANAGPDQKLPQGSSTTILQANSAESGIGSWHFLEEGDGNGVIADTNAHNSSFSGTQGQQYVLTWTIETPDCSSSSSDEVSITFLKPTPLSLGDLIFIAYSADNDDFAFTLLKDVEAGTSISFTDRGWLTEGGFREGEGTLTVTLCRPYQCGDEFNVFDLTQEIKDASGRIAGSLSGQQLDLSTSGDQIFAYQGTPPTADNQNSFLAAIQMNGDWDTGDIGTVESSLPSIFTNGTNALAIVPERDNAYYDCSINGPIGALDTRLAVNNSANWVSNDSLSATLPLNCMLGCCADYTLSGITGLDETAYCVGELAKLTIEGDLGGAEDWVWYEGGCGTGEPIGKGKTINYIATSTTNIFVRGENGCQDINENCLSILLEIDDTLPTALCKDISIPLGSAITPESINNGSFDDCDEFSLSLSIDTFQCNQLGENLVTLRIEDAAGLSSSCTALVTIEAPDEDCDLVADECDMCPSGDDKVDIDNNGVPDCTEFTGIENVLQAWKCGPSLENVFVCSIVDGDPTSAQTFCVPPENINDILLAGGYLGPCGNTPCGTITPIWTIPTAYQVQIYPNPVQDLVFVELGFDSPQKGEIILFNNIGQVVKKVAISLGSKTRHPILLNELGNGIYFVDIRLGGNTIFLKEKLVISR